MPTGSDHVCLPGKTGSDRRTVKVTRLTPNGHLRELEALDGAVARDKMAQLRGMAYGSAQGVSAARPAYDERDGA
jgi:hypothetical protein